MQKSDDYPVSGETQRIAVTSSDIQAVAEAIEDEIYDYGYQRFGFDYAGRKIAPNKYRLRLYVRPYLGRGRRLGDVGKGEGFVIYKYLPFGEVFRMFTIKKNGLAILYGNPEFGFPPTEPNFLTVYMGDDQLETYKRDWTRGYFVVDSNPPAERLRDAADRQVRRIGYSVRLDPSRRIVPEGQDPRCPASATLNRKSPQRARPN